MAKGITVSELIKQLKECDPNRIVIISKDSEGNDYSPFSGFYEASYKANSTWSGEIGLETLTEEDRKSGYSEEDVLEDGVPCVVLRPTN